MRKVTLTALLLTTLVSCQNYDPFFHVTGEYYLLRTSADNVFIAPKVRGSRTPWIPPKVIKRSWNKNYIIAKQIYAPGISLKTNSSEHDVSYWILSLENQESLGSLNKADFEKKCQKMT